MNEQLITRFETLIQQLLENGFAIADDFLPVDLVTALRQRIFHLFYTGQMKPAGIGRENQFQKNEEIRRDLISWIEPSVAVGIEKEFLQLIQSFVDYLNQTCYTGLNGFEFHYAFYDTGSFYKRHIDQFKSNSGRKYSVVIYLNENWKEEDGGQLVLYKDGNAIKISPDAGRIVFFESDKIEHEVLQANRPRMSVTGWLKRVN